MEQRKSLDQLFVKAHNLLSKTKTPYLLIGGLAAGVMGQPRFTQDADFLVFISRSKLRRFLSFARQEGFEVDKQEVERSVRERGVFSLPLGKYHADFVINALRFGKSALRRAITLKFFGRDVSFPTPEDLILIKLIAGRELDIIDARSIYARHQKTLDQKYIFGQAQEICDETEDMRVWNSLVKLLGKAHYG